MSEKEQEQKKRSPVLLIIFGLLWLLASGAAIWMFVANSDLSKEKLQIEAKKVELEKEIDQVQKQLDIRNTELTNKDSEIKDLTEKLEHASERLSELEKLRAISAGKSGDFKNRIRELEERILTIMETSERAKSDLEVSKVENQTLNDRIRKLEDRSRNDSIDKAKQKAELDRITGTLNEIYIAHEFQFINVKQERNVMHKKKRIKKNFTIKFKLDDYAHKGVSKAPKDLTCLILGVGTKNRDFKRETEVLECSGGEAVLKFQNEPFPAGLYHLSVRYKKTNIGDAGFLVR